MGRREQWFGELVSAWPFGNSRELDERAGFYRPFGRSLKQILPLGPEFDNLLDGAAQRERFTRALSMGFVEESPDETVRPPTLERSRLRDQ